jgi:tripartite-type tricarboxylate transporter receptor subunit TctC
MLWNKSFGKGTRLTAIMAVAILLGFTVAPGAEYPTRPVKIIIPYSAGGVSDLTWRSMSDTIAKSLGQPLIIENKAGGGTTLGTTIVAAAKPDGYTVGHLTMGTFINNCLSYEVSYDPLKSFSYVAGVAYYAQSIIVKPDSPWKTWDEFVDYSKKNPNAIRMGFSNVVGTNSVSAKWIAKKLGLQWKYVTFPAEAEAITAFLGGHIDAYPGGGAHNILVKDGRARMLLALTIDPIPGYPQVPTFKELYKRDVMNANGMLAPKGVPSQALAKLEKAVQEGTQSSEFIKTMGKMDMTPRFRNSKEFTEDIQAALVSFQELLKDLDMLKKQATPPKQ